MSEGLDQLIVGLVADALAEVCDCQAMPVMSFHCLAQDRTGDAAWYPLGPLDGRDPYTDGGTYLIGLDRGWWDRWRVDCPECGRVYAEGWDTGPCVS